MQISRKIQMLCFMLLLPLMAVAQWEDPVRFEVKQKRISPSEIVLTFHGKVEDGWHVYSSDTKEGGPTVAVFQLENAKGVEKVGKLLPKSAVKEKYDEMFAMQVRYLEGTAIFEQRLKITAKEYSAEGYLEYGACNDATCMPPTQVSFQVKGSDGPSALSTSVKEEQVTDDKEVALSSTNTDESALGDNIVKDTIKTDTAATTLPAYWQPEVEEMQTQGDGMAQSSLWLVFLMGLLGGLIAVVTPCVWPIIPMTISYFLKRAEHKGKSLRDALLYGLSIIVIYVSLGLLITLAFGSNGLNELSTSALFNLVCFAILVVFAASFLGGFEIMLPSSWGNKTDSKADEKGGVIGIFLMALTLTIVSFSCTGPIIGFLLVDITTQSNYMAPAIGMLGFAVALALPFTVFALFPSLIKKAPRSGSWMNTVKVVLGFVELAFALKFLSVADMAYNWHILDREVFLSLWIVLFALLGIYLLGKLRMPADSPQEHTSIPGFFGGLISLAFAVYMLPGLWGAPLKAISAFTPPMSTQDFNMNPSAQVEAQFTNYDEAVAYAQQVGKPLLLDFTGFGCVNCRKMEAKVWTDPQVAKMLKEQFVLVSLYVDDRTPLDQPFEADVNGEHIVLKTKGKLWSFLQSYKFGANTQPFYVPVDAQGKPLNKSYSYNEDIQQYISFLQTSLTNYQSNK